MLAQRRRIDPIEVVQDWTERLHSKVGIPFRSPSGFKPDSKVVPEKRVGTKARKCSPAHCLGEIVCSRARCRRGRQAADSEGGIELLAVSRADAEKKHADRTN